MKNTLEQQVEKLQAFKDYVHKRLDDAGIEKEPKGEHSEHGCRIGDRIDIVLSRINTDKEWIVILPDGSNLPKIDFHTQYWFHNGESVWIDTMSLAMKLGNDPITHYQPIQKPKNPIF